MKLTAPVGAATDDGLATVAVNVTGAPTSDGFKLDTSVTAAVPRIVSDNGEDVPGGYVASPL